MSNDLETEIKMGWNGFGMPPELHSNSELDDLDRLYHAYLAGEKGETRYAGVMRVLKRYGIELKRIKGGYTL